MRRLRRYILIIASVLVLLSLAGVVYVLVAPKGALATLSGSSQIQTGHTSIPMQQFLTDADLEIIKHGTIQYYLVTDLATLIGDKDGPEGNAPSKVVEAIGRLSTADISMLRKRGFNETFVEKPAVPPVPLWRSIALEGGKILGFILAAGLGIFALVKVQQRTILGSRTTIEAEKGSVLFADVAGCDEAKEEVSEVVDFLKNPDRFRIAGGRMPKGVLLVGPPGTGKTLIAKAVAGEADVPFFRASGSDFVELYVGVGASRIRSLFRKARAAAPCIIFIDELDSVGRQRAAGGGRGNDEAEQTLNALLVEMDGFDECSKVVVFAATNRPEVLDAALRRPGRFDREVTVDLPDVDGRLAILKVHRRTVNLSNSVNLRDVAKSTSGFSGADLANLLNEAALHAARRQASTVTAIEIDEARDKIRWGRERRRIMTDGDRRTIAYHEAGHALVQVLSNGDANHKLQKVTIIPRGNSLGSTLFTQEHDSINYSETQLLHQLRCLVGGRIAEQLALGQMTSGASGDIKQATNIARRMVFEWGMSPLGFIAVGDASGANDATPAASPALVERAEAHMRTIVEREYAAAHALLSSHLEQLHGIASALLDKETILSDEVMKIAGLA